MDDKDPPIQISPLRGGITNEVIIRSEEEVERESSLIRHYSRNAYGEVRTIKEIRMKNTDEYIKLSELELKDILERATHFTGVSVIILVVLISSWLIVSPNSNQQQMDTASKLVFLIIGAILGRLFPNKKDEKRD